MISLSLERDKREWMARNRGVITRVSAELGLSHEYVRSVFWERATSPESRIEKRLIELGAPGFAGNSADQLVA